VAIMFSLRTKQVCKICEEAISTIIIKYDYFCFTIG
jgi:hypothetical protein